MVLMDTRVDLPPPNRASTQLVSVSAFGHEDVAGLQAVLANLRSQNLNLLDFRQIKVASLDVCHA